MPVSMIWSVIGCLAFNKIGDPDDTASNTNEPTNDTIEDTGTIDDSGIIEDTSIPDDTNIDDTADTSTQEDGPILFFEDEFQVGGTQQWANLWPTSNGFLFSTMQNEQVAFRRYDLDFNPQNNLTLVTGLGDFPPGIQMADHEFLRMNNGLYFVASGFGDQDLIIVKTDLQGNRLAKLTIQESVAIDCNDPHLLIVNENVCVRWGTSGTQKYVQCFDEALRPVTTTPISITTPEPIPQLGFSMQVDNEIWSFTGDAPQRDLIISKYDTTWTPLSTFTEIILESENDNWNWFPGGVVHHEELDLWFVAFTHMEDGQAADFDSVVKLAAFDENFQLLDIKTLSGPGYTRPNLVLVGDYLIVSYDNTNLVWLEKWRIEAPANTEASEGTEATE